MEEGFSLFALIGWRLWAIYDPIAIALTMLAGVGGLRRMKMQTGGLGREKNIQKYENKR